MRLERLPQEFRKESGMRTKKQKTGRRHHGMRPWLLSVLARGSILALERIPSGWCYRLGRFSGWVAWRMLAFRRSVVRKNLEIVRAWPGANENAGRGKNGVLDEKQTGSGKRVEAGAGRERMPGAGVAAASVHSGPWSGGQMGEPARAEQPDAGVPEAAGSGPGASVDKAAPPGAETSGVASAPIDQQVGEVFKRAGANLFSSIAIGCLPSERLAEHFEVEGADVLRENVRQGRGGLLLVAHMGPWEALVRLSELLAREGVEVKLGALYRPFNNPYFDAWYRKRRERSGIRLFSSKEGFLAPVEFLRQGGLLGVLADQRLSSGERVPFFGKETAVTPMPGLLGLRASVPVYSLSVQTIGRLRWRLRLRACDPFEGTSDHRRERIARQISHAMERVLADSICDGFWFHNRFKERTERPAANG